MVKQEPLGGQGQLPDVLCIVSGVCLQRPSECHISSPLGNQCSPKSSGFCPRSPPETAFGGPTVNIGLLTLAQGSLCLWREALIEG